MWKKMAVLAIVFFLSVAGINENVLEVFAEDVGEEVDASELLTEDAIVGYMEGQTKGVYLSHGYSAIKDGGSGKIIAGGGTYAAKRCEVTLNVIVERLEGGSWYRVTSWVASDENALSVISSKVLTVGKGYYYRVRCLHSAASDASSSCSSGLWV